MNAFAQCIQGGLTQPDIQNKELVRLYQLGAKYKKMKPELTTNKQLLNALDEAIEKATPEELAEFRRAVREKAGLPPQREELLESPEEKDSNDPHT